jgi:hypothetical protein
MAAALMASRGSTPRTEDETRSLTAEAEEEILAMFERGMALVPEPRLGLALANVRPFVPSERSARSNLSTPTNSFRQDPSFRLQEADASVAAWQPTAYLDSCCTQEWLEVAPREALARRISALERNLQYHLAIHREKEARRGQLDERSRKPASTRTVSPVSTITDVRSRSATPLANFASARDCASATTRSLRSQRAEIPNEFLCPITYEVMVDPVVAGTSPAGHRSLAKEAPRRRRWPCLPPNRRAPCPCLQRMVSPTSATRLRCGLSPTTPRHSRARPFRSSL